MIEFIETNKGLIKASAIVAVRPLEESETTKERVVIDYTFGDRANSVIYVMRTIKGIK
jgi:hypothetical protein